MALGSESNHHDDDKTAHVEKLGDTAKPTMGVWKNKESKITPILETSIEPDGQTLFCTSPIPSTSLGRGFSRRLGSA